MRDLVIDHLAEVIDFGIYAVASLFVSGLGIGIETDGIQNLLSGQVTLGAWELFMGAIGLYVGIYLLGYHEVLPRLRTIRAGAPDRSSRSTVENVPSRISKSEVT